MPPCSTVMRRNSWQRRVRNDLLQRCLSRGESCFHGSSTTFKSFNATNRCFMRLLVLQRWRHDKRKRHMKVWFVSFTRRCLWKTNRAKTLMAVHSRLSITVYVISRRKLYCSRVQQIGKLTSHIPSSRFAIYQSGINV